MGQPIGMGDIGRYASDQQAFEEWGVSKVPGGLRHCNGQLSVSPLLHLPDEMPHDQ